MINEKRKQEIRERHQQIEFKRAAFGDIPLGSGLFAHQDRAVLLSALEEVEAELAKKAAEIALWREDREVVGSKLMQVQASLTRAREALRAKSIHMRQKQCWCAVCASGIWVLGEAESHNPVTINGVSGPCPAAPEGEQG